MQYLIKLTVLNVKERIFRLLSADGANETDHVLNLCSLAFDYDNYEDRKLYFATGKEQLRRLRILADPDLADDGSYGPLTERAPFYESFPRVEDLLKNGTVKCLDLCHSPSDRLKSFDELLREQAGETADLKNTEDTHPADSSDRLLFIFELRGVAHLAEIMESSQKLKCFVPAVLAGRTVISDEDGDLSFAKIQKQAAAAAEAEEERILDLRECTTRLRSLKEVKSERTVSDMLVHAGAAPLKFSTED